MPQYDVNDIKIKDAHSGEYANTDSNETVYIALRCDDKMYGCWENKQAVARYCRDHLISMKEEWFDVVGLPAHTVRIDDVHVKNNHSIFENIK